MAIVSNHTPKEYMESMRYYMESHFDFGMERFTGFFLWRFFYVTHHAGREWNRKITNQKNAAMGFVTKSRDGCKVHYLRFRAFMCPLRFLACCAMSFLIYWSGRRTASADSKAIFLAVSILISAPISAVVESFTERGEYGRKCLVSFLMDPADPLANYRKIP